MSVSEREKVRAFLRSFREEEDSAVTKNSDKEASPCISEGIELYGLASDILHKKGSQNQFCGKITHQKMVDMENRAAVVSLFLPDRNSHYISIRINDPYVGLISRFFLKVNCNGVCSLREDYKNTVLEATFEQIQRYKGYVQKLI